MDQARRTPLPPVRTATASQLKIRGHSLQATPRTAPTRSMSSEPTAARRHGPPPSDRDQPRFRDSPMSSTRASRVGSSPTSRSSLSRATSGLLRRKQGCHDVPTSWLSVVWRNYGGAKPKARSHISMIQSRGEFSRRNVAADAPGSGGTPSFCLAHPDRSRRGSPSSGPGETGSSAGTGLVGVS